MLHRLIAYIGKRTGTESYPSTASVRLRELDGEVDLEHVLPLGAAAIGSVGAVLAVAVNGTFALLPIFAFALLAQYAIQGWCLPVPLLTRLGLRSSSDIDRERYALAASVAEGHEPRLFTVRRAGAD